MHAAGVCKRCASNGSAMASTSIESSEGERRIRAAVRVCLSKGVWLVLAVQMVLFFALREPRIVGDVPDAVRVIMVALAVAAFLYLVAGVSQALANERDAVGVRASLQAGVTSFGPFLWLIVKVALLAGLTLNILLPFIATPGSADRAVLPEPLLQAFPLIEGLISFVFVYWLPVVFVQRKFALFATLRVALITAWERLPHAAYLAFLTLAPVVPALFLPDATPLVIMLALSLLAGLMDWIAYDYCVQSLHAESAPAAA